MRLFLVVSSIWAFALAVPLPYPNLQFDEYSQLRTSGILEARQGSVGGVAGGVAGSAASGGSADLPQGAGGVDGQASGVEQPRNTTGTPVSNSTTTIVSSTSVVSKSSAKPSKPSPTYVPAPGTGPEPYLRPLVPTPASLGETGFDPLVYESGIPSIGQVLSGIFKRNMEEMLKNEGQLEVRQNGQRGADGAPGADGTRGVDGARGTDGARGADGAPGHAVVGVPMPTMPTEIASTFDPSSSSPLVGGVVGVPGTMGANDIAFVQSS